MRRVTHIFQHRPDMSGQAQQHCRTSSFQRAVRSDPVVNIPPQPQRPLQHAAQSRNIAGTSGQSCLLAAQRSIEPLQMRGVYLPTDMQFPDTMFDVSQSSEQRMCGDFEQIASPIADFPDNANQQSERRLEDRFALSATPLPFSSTMLYKPKNTQNRCWIRQMLVDKYKRQMAIETTKRYRGNKLAGQFQCAWAYPKVYKKPAYYLQCRMNPRTTLWTMWATPSLADPLFCPPATRVCSSSSWTAWTDCLSRSSCSRWKSSARLPAFSSIRSTVLGSTSQMSAVASIEQPWDKHLIIRTTTASGNLVLCISEPSLSLKRQPQVLQYNRRMALSLPIRSAMDRLPALNLLKSAQFWFGQAKKERGNSGNTGSLCRDGWFLSIRSLLAEKRYYSNNSSAKTPFGLQNRYYCMPIS